MGKIWYEEDLLVLEEYQPDLIRLALAACGFSGFILKEAATTTVLPSSPP